jgi:xanthine dehydrogenase YagS FAD-binding subunit
MRAFEYVAPTTPIDAVELLTGRDGTAMVLAGGTDLLALMKDDVLRPTRLVDVKGIPELGTISYDARAGLRIGAAVTLDALAAHPDVRRSYPSLVQAALGITSAQIRARGTVGGDLCQRPRCWYFRAGFGLLALRNGRSMVTDGDDRYHAILGNAGPAYFVSASSLAPALIALGARIQVLGTQLSHEVSLGSFFRVPRQEGEREIDLAPDDLVLEIVVPPATGQPNATYEVRQKEALDWPLAAAAVKLETAGGVVQRARIVLGHVAPIPWSAQAAEKALVGKAITEETAAQAGEAAVLGAKALGRNGYKIQLARVAVKRALLRASGKEVPA